MMIQFLVPHVINLVENGFEVEIACSEVGGRMEEIRQKLDGYVKVIHTVRLVRSPASLGNLKGYRDMKRVIDTGHYDIIWTNEPVMGVVTRLAARKARKNGTKVLYMVHGFHFYTGAPVLNWIVFYPVEKFASRFCDEIVTINREDYVRAKKFHASFVEYIHGIGVNTERLQKKGKNDIRNELNLDKEDFLLVSVGELNKNKNHKVVLYALGQLKDISLHYVICGKGKQLDILKTIAAEQGITKQVHFMGYRKDIVDICSHSDVFVFPSLREGLGLAALEAMYCGLPLVTSRARGLVDIMENGVSGYLCEPNDVRAFANAIANLKADNELRKRMSEWNKEAVIPFCIENAKREVLCLIESIGSRV